MKTLGDRIKAMTQLSAISKKLTWLGKPSVNWRPKVGNQSAKQMKVTDRAGMENLAADKADFKLKLIQSIKKGQSVLIKETIRQEHATIRNI